MAEQTGRPHVQQLLLFYFSSSPVTLSMQRYDDSLVPYTIDARPGYGTSTHAPTMRSRWTRRSSRLLSLKVCLLSTRAPIAPLDRSLAPYIPDRTYLVRPRVVFSSAAR
jgi:hypothetical protein